MTAGTEDTARSHEIAQTFWMGHWRRTWYVGPNGDSRFEIHYTPFGRFEYRRIPCWLARRLRCPLAIPL